MKLFVINWGGKELGMIDAVRELQKEHRIIYWTCPHLRRNVDRREFPNTILHEREDALHGIPPTGFLLDVPPADPELLHALSETESLVLTMMNKHFERMGVSERKSLYYYLVAYWDAVLREHRPDAVIFPTIPHSVYDFIVYALAARAGIKTVMMEPIWIGDRVLIMKDYLTGPNYLFARKNASFGISQGALAPDFAQEYALQLRKGTDPTPVFVKNIKRRYSGLPLLAIKARSLITSLIVHKDFSVLARLAGFPFKRLKQNLRFEYERIAKPPDLSKPFVYLPFHYQPERNSSPQGGVFVDQLYLASILSASLPEGWKIYVKEHPTQWLYRGTEFFSYRFRGYYEALSRIKGVEIVPVKTDTYALTANARAVATITGTAGYEAMLRRKPVLAFGYPWYKGAPGLFEVRDISSCREAMRRIAAGVVFDEEAVLRYLQGLDAGTFHGYIDADGQAVSSLSPLENAHVLAREISAILRK